MVAIIQRINDLIKANLNHMIDQAEEPEKMLKQIIHEMDDNIHEAKIAVVSAITSEKQLYKQLQEHRSKSIAWTEKAEYALQNDHEDLARTALSRKIDHDRIAASLESSWKKAKNTCERLKDQLKALEAKKAEAYHRLHGLIARQRAASAQQYLSKTLITFQDTMETQTKFVRMEERVAEAEAEAEAISEIMNEPAPLEREFMDMETKIKVNEQLAALKNKIRANTQQADSGQ